MIIAVFYNKNIEWDIKQDNGYYDRHIVGTCGTDSVFKPDQRLTIRNMHYKTIERLEKLKRVKKYDFYRLHQVRSYRDLTDNRNSISEYAEIQYKGE